MRLQHTRRSGASAVEGALIYPLTFFLLIGLVVAAQGVARYQETGALARSAARYASTHGAQYRKDTGQPVGSAGTPAGERGGLFWYSVNAAQPAGAAAGWAGADAGWAGDIYESAVRPRLVTLDPALLTIQVGYPPVVNQSTKPDNWPGSQVTVTVSYQWLPDLYLVGPLTLSSTSSLPITN